MRLPMKITVVGAGYVGLSNAVQIYERVKLHFYGINYMPMKYKDKINCNKQLIIEMKMNFLRFFLSYSHVPRKVH